MSRRLAQCLTGIAIAALLGAVSVALIRRSRRRIERSERQRQRTPEGDPIEDEWGRESFPASDPPQSW